MTALDETVFGARNARGEWRPRKLVLSPPVPVWPPKPVAIVKWFFGFPGFLLPFNALYALVAIAVWTWATPSLNTLQRLAPGWILFLLVRNLAIVFVWFGAAHWWLYGRRGQDTQTKYNAKWPSAKSSLFSFGSQYKDNMFWTLASGVTTMTAYEALTLWMYANNRIPWLRNASPLIMVAWFVAVVFIREVHFWLVHRLIHSKALYKTVHSLHHRNVNPTPWSGLSMHPLEHLLYFSGVLVHWIIPSHPVHAMYNLMHATLAPVPGHSGFDRVELTDGTSLPTGCLAHYLHHKYFEVNYSDGLIPLDRWFGSFHDGSPEADDRLRARITARRALNQQPAE